MAKSDYNFRNSPGYRKGDMLIDVVPVEGKAQIFFVSHVDGDTVDRFEGMYVMLGTS